jgi:lipopolysaccharide transport system permease protein
MNKDHERIWDKVIRPRNGWFDIHLGELWKYRDLIGLFVWRDFVSIRFGTLFSRSSPR